MNSRFRWLVPLLALITLGPQGAGSAAPAATPQSLERTLKVNGALELEVRTGSEDLSVRSGDDESVVIKCIVRPQNDGDDDNDEPENNPTVVESDLRIRQEGNHISIDPIEDRAKLRHLNVRYEITAPVNTRLSYEAGSGDLNVEGIRGPVEYTSGSGDVRVLSAQERIHVHTGSGDVSLEEVGRGAIEVETQSGDVDVRLAPQAGYDLTAHTSSGDISVAPELTLEPGDVKNDVRGKVRGGGKEVRIRTGSGDIRIE